MIPDGRRAREGRRSIFLLPSALPLLGDDHSERRFRHEDVLFRNVVLYFLFTRLHFILDVIIIVVVVAGIVKGFGTRTVGG